MMNHQPRRVLDSQQVIVLDDFLPEDVFQTVYDYVLTTDYERITSSGGPWYTHDAFPLLSVKNVYYAPLDKGRDEAADGGKQVKSSSDAGKSVYPSNTPVDLLVKQMVAAQPQVEHLTGKFGEAWDQFSVRAWLYPPRTGVSLHHDEGGSFVYFVNPTWRAHWGGLLLIPDEEGSRMIDAGRAAAGAQDFDKKLWLHAAGADELLMQRGFAQSIFPKRNRIVYIRPGAYHLITRINEQAGDNLRMCLLGLFSRHQGRKNW